MTPTHPPTAQLVRGIPPPRVTVRKPAAAKMLRAQRILTICFLTAALSLVGLTLIRIYVAILGTPVNAVVEGVEKTYAKNAVNYFVNFHYDFAGKQRKDYAAIEPEEYVRYSPGDQLPARVAVFAGVVFCVTPGHATKNTVMMGVVSCVFLGLAWFCFWAFYLRPEAQRRLLQDGRAIDATVTGVKRPAKAGSAPSYVYFQFTPAGAHDPVTSKQRILSTQAEHERTGRPILVFYSEADPTRCVPYEYSDYTIDGLPESH